MHMLAWMVVLGRLIALVIPFGPFGDRRSILRGYGSMTVRSILKGVDVAVRRAAA